MFVILVIDFKTRHHIKVLSDHPCVGGWKMYSQEGTVTVVKDLHLIFKFVLPYNCFLKTQIDSTSIYSVYKKSEDKFKIGFAYTSIKMAQLLSVFMETAILAMRNWDHLQNRYPRVQKCV